jgi:hypothetical protein
MLTTFALVSLGWIFFRSTSMTQAVGLLERALKPWEFSYRALSGTFYLQTALLVLATWAAPFAARGAAALAGAKEEGSASGGYAYWLVQGGLMGAMLVLCLVYLRGQTAFIYFQF